MGLSLINIPPTFAGIVPEGYARNGLPPNGDYARNLAAQINHLLGRHGTVIPGKSVLPAAARNSASELALWRRYYRATLNGTTLVSEVHLIPTDTTSGTPRWYVKVDGVAQTTQQHNVRCNTGAGTALDDRFVRIQEITVSANAYHKLELWTRDNCRVVGWFLYEKPRPTLTIGTDTVVDYTTILPLSGIFDADVAALIARLDDVRKKYRHQHIAFSVNDPASPIVPTTTATNPWDTSTARGAASVGMTCPTEYRNTYMDEVASTLQIPTVCWAYGERTSVGGSITVRFIGENGSTDVTINSTAEFYTSTSFTLQPRTLGDKVDVHILKDVAGTTGNVYDFGMFPLI